MAIGCVARAQEVRLEAQATASGGDYTPLWLNANRQGLSSLDPDNAYVRAAFFRSAEADSARRWKRALGADMALAAGFTSTMVVQQLYAQVGWGKGLLTLGAKEQQLQLKDQLLSSGSQTLGINARPVPGVRLELPDYWAVPGLNGWLGFKGHLFYGWTTDDGWQRDFTNCQHERTEHTMLHTKAGYLRFGRPQKPFNLEMGLEMGCQFGGDSWLAFTEPSLQHFSNGKGFKSFWRALVPSGAESMETALDYQNMEGNHVGSWLLRANYDRSGWGVSLYADHFFEDQSQMFFLDYDGYGDGTEWDKWKHSRWLVYDLRDIMLGVELRLKRCQWVNTVVAEYLSTQYQSGPLYHDHTRVISDHLGGRDNYYNHSVFTGWQHWGQVLGNPLYRSPLYNDDARIRVLDNRFTAWHLGVSGQPGQSLHYRMLATWQRGLGTYEQPFLNPRHNFSFLAEADYTLSRPTCLAGMSLRGAIAFDRGSLLGNNAGLQLTVARRFGL